MPGESLAAAPRFLFPRNEKVGEAIVQTIGDMKSTHAQSGRVEWIGLAAERRGRIEIVSQVTAEPGSGLAGEHHASGESKREVTLIQAEHLSVIAALLGRQDLIDPTLLRRNVMVSGISLLTLKDQRFRIGEVVLEGSGLAVPCSRMEENLGPGGYNAMRGHGGITARVIEGGAISVGDEVDAVCG